MVMERTCPTCGREAETVGPDGYQCSAGHQWAKGRQPAGPSRKPEPKPDLEPIHRPVPGQVVREVCAAELRLKGMPELDYLPFLGQEGFIVRGWATMIAGYPKAGKTELTNALCLDWQKESILYITEEPETIWAARLSRHEKGCEHIQLVFGLGTEPSDLLQRIIAGNETVVILDTVRNLLKLRDETDNSEVARALTPFIAACRESNKTLLLLHHIRKGGGNYGEGITGGHAFLGIVDCALQILREQNLGENRRKVVGLGRITSIPELVYSLNETGDLEALGSPDAVQIDQVKQNALEALGDEPQTVKDILAALPEPKPSAKHLRTALNGLYKEGKADREPKEDKPGASYRFSKPDLERPFFKVPGQVTEGEQYYLNLADNIQAN